MLYATPSCRSLPVPRPETEDKCRPALLSFCRGAPTWGWIRRLGVVVSQTTGHGLIPEDPSWEVLRCRCSVTVTVSRHATTLGNRYGECGRSLVDPCVEPGIVSQYRERPRRGYRSVRWCIHLTCTPSSPVLIM